LSFVVMIAMSQNCCTIPRHIRILRCYKVLAENTADVFLTTDDDILKITSAADTLIEVANPLAWLQRRTA